MQASLVLTILGPDRAGLVKAIAETVKNHQGNWQESRMVQLAGQFAGLVHVTLPAGQTESLVAALGTLQQDGLQILVRQGESITRPVYTPLTLELLGNDRPGIIHDITRVLVGLGINVEELASEQRAAPMSNELLFYAKLRLGLPAGVQPQDVEGAFAALPDPLMVDLTFVDKA